MSEPLWLASPDLPRPAAARPPINLRSLSLGFLGVILICALTPYNDYALNNTFLVGNNLPLGVVMLLFVSALAINGPLNRFLPHLAFSTGEMAVAFSITLISCTLPSSGLMRYFPPSLIAPFWHARSNYWAMEVLQKVHLAKWIFPTFTGSTPQDWANDRVVKEYVTRTDPLATPPYSAWFIPAFTWLIFLMALYGALMCMVTIVRRQWYDNERLAFPLAQIYLPLLQQPENGRWLAPLFRSKLFWSAFAGVFVLHLWNGLNQYSPQNFPRIPLTYDVQEVMTERPWIFTAIGFKRATIFFTVVGVMYFVPRSVSFSLWFFFILSQMQRMGLGKTSGDPEWKGGSERNFGAVAAFAVAVIWVGRKHWALVLWSALSRARRGDHGGRYLPYRAAFWGLVGCFLVMVIWLTLAGASVGGAIVMILCLLLLFFVITRVIAETGMVQGQLDPGLITKPIDLVDIAGSTHPALAFLKEPVPVSTYYLNGMLEAVHYDFREPMPVYASHAMKVADETVFDGKSVESDGKAERRMGRQLVIAMMLALAVGYFVSLGSTLYTEYHNADTRDISHEEPINSWGIGVSGWTMLGSTHNYMKHHYDLDYSPPKQFAIGLIVTAFLAAMRLRFTWWPLHPIGFLLLGLFPSDVMWFSIFLGWLAKTLILKFGGSQMYLSARNFFLGLIVGESMAAGFWLVLGIVMSISDLPYRPVLIMPR